MSSVDVDLKQTHHVDGKDANKLDQHHHKSGWTVRDFFYALMDCYETYKELTLAYIQSDGTVVNQYLHIRVLIGHVDWRETRLMVYRPNYPQPALYSKIHALNDKQLVIRGAMIFNRPNRYDKYQLTIKPPMGDDPSRFDARLEVTGYVTMHLELAPKKRSCIVPELAFLPYDQVRTIMVKNQQILYEHQIYWFDHEHDQNTIVLRSETTKRQVSSDCCMVIYEVTPTKHRTLVGSMRLEQVDMSMSDCDSILSDQDFTDEINLNVSI